MEEQAERRGEPAEEDARRLLEAVTGKRVVSLARFAEGAAHYVYDAELAGGERRVARLARRGADDFAGTVYWRDWLRPLGVPLPALDYADAGGEEHGFPSLIMERLPGTDLGAVYLSLSGSERRALAGEVAAIQQAVGRLPQGNGFGYARRYGDPSLQPSWLALIEAHVERSRQWIEAAGVVDPAVVAPVRSALVRHEAALREVEPVAFLDDTTTRNVIVAGGRLSGIVDVDRVCFGDPLFTPALTRMALLARGYPLDYLDAWLERLQLSAARRRLLDLYTALFALNFLGELGQRFNRVRPQPVDPAQRRRLLALLRGLLAATLG